MRGRRKSRLHLAAPLLLLLLYSSLTLAVQEITQGPNDTQVLIGKTATLTCKVANQRGAVQWTKNGFGLGTDRQLRLFSRYSMIGSAANGEYNLRIENVTIGDDDTYSCQVSEADDEPSVVSRSAKLVVLVRPTPPKMLSRALSGVEAIAGQELQHSCLVRRGKPLPRIGWAISADSHGRSISAWLGETRSRFAEIFKQHGYQESVPAAIEEDKQIDGDAFSVISNITFAPRPEDDKKYLLCVTQHETFLDKVEIDAVRLNLKYAPRVQLKLAGPGRLREGGTALLACDVDAKPHDDLTIAWFHGDTQLTRHTTDTLPLEELTASDHLTEYSCQASNSIGTNKDTIKLNVSYAPRIKTASQEKEANEGDSVFFQCEANGNPPPLVFWSKAGDEQIIEKGETLRIDSVNAWQQGVYICTAVVDSFEHVKQSHHLFIRGAPSVSMTEEQLAALGESVQIACAVSGRPKAREVEWWKDGVRLTFTSGRHQMNQIPHPWGVESRLVIRDVNDGDLGSYNCTGKNGLGVDSKLVRLRRKSILDLIGLENQLLLPLLVALLCLLLLCVCCFLCRRRSHFKRGGSKFIDDQSDVTVKCEALDAPFFPDIYGSPLENGNVISSKDYISIPQNNPDLDFSGPPSTGGIPPPGLYPKYLDNSLSDYNGRYEQHSYGSFVSGVSSPNGLQQNHPQHGDVYIQATTMPPMVAPAPEKLTYVVSGIGLSVDGAPLEPLHEVDTPKASTYSFGALPDVRPISRTSTHV